MSIATQPAAAPARAWDRLPLLGGIAAGAIQIAFSALFFGFVLPHLPPIDAPAPQAAAFYAEQSRNGMYMLTSYLLEAQMPFLMLFFGGLFGLLRRHEGGSGALSAAIFAAGVALSVMTPLVDMIEDHTLLGLAAAGGDPLTVRVFDGMVPQAQALSGFAEALVLFGVAALILARGFAPRWLAWLALGLGGLSLLSTATLVAPAMFPATALAELLFKLWMLALSVALLRGSARAARPAARRLAV